MKSRANTRGKSLFGLLTIAMAIVQMCFISGIVNAQSATELYISAGQSYKAKQFREAAEAYGKLLTQNYRNAEVYYNLGNCYYKMDSIGACILNYERALKITPKDEDIMYNLKLAKLKSVDAIQPVPQLAIIAWWNQFVSFNSSKGWSMIALFAIWLCLFVIACYLFFIRKRILKMVAALLLLVSFSAMGLAANQHRKEVRSDLAVLMVASTFVKSAPDTGAADLFMIHEGATMLMLDHVGEWTRIRLEDGKIGWLVSESFEKI